MSSKPNQRDPIIQIILQAARRGRTILAEREKSQRAQAVQPSKTSKETQKENK